MEIKNLKAILMAILSQPMSGRPYNEDEKKNLSKNAETIISLCEKKTKNEQ